MQEINNIIRDLGLNEVLYSDYNKIARAAKVRLQICMLAFMLGFMALSIKLVNVSLFSDILTKTNKYVAENGYIHRKEVVDRNNVLLAVNLTTASLYANPRMISDPVDTAKELKRIFPTLVSDNLLKELQSQKKFVWIKRNITPKEQYAVNSLGIPGLMFEKGEKRVYPHGSLAAHILGFVGVDGQGLAGIEKSLNDKIIDHESNPKKPIKLSIDIRLQDIMHEELTKKIEEFNAIGAVGIIADANNGEILSMVSLPDFDPHDPATATDDQRFNRATLGLYEMGSTFKTFTIAMGLENGTISLNDTYDVDEPIRVARFRITDYHARGGILSVPEIFMYSSNIGTAKISLDVGSDYQKKFLSDLGLLSYLEIETPEKSHPLYPDRSKWGDLSTMTISYGHGLAVTPMHMVKAMMPVVNGGKVYPITMMKNSSKPKSINVMSLDTSKDMRKLLRLVVDQGTGRKANAEGYLVGGKTGTADKARKGGYNRNARLSSFIGAFPINDPKYVVLVMLDEPKGNKSTGGYATAGYVAAPAVKEIVSRAAPILGIEPIDEEEKEVQNLLNINFNSYNKNEL